VTLVPSAYLFGGSFGNLDQLRVMYGVDMIVSAVLRPERNFDGDRAQALSHLLDALRCAFDQVATRTRLNTLPGRRRV